MSAAACIANATVFLIYMPRRPIADIASVCHAISDKPRGTDRYHGIVRGLHTVLLHSSEVVFPKIKDPYSFSIRKERRKKREEREKGPSL